MHHARGHNDLVLPAREEFLNNLQFVGAEDLPPEERECGVCCDERESYMSLPCGLIQCSTCVEAIFAAGRLDNRCPHCRQQLFRQAAPWDRIEIRLYLCSELLITTCEFIRVLQIVWRVVGIAGSPASGTEIMALFEIVESVYDRSRIVLGLAKLLDGKDIAVWEGLRFIPTTIDLTTQMLTLVTVPWAIERVSFG